MMSYYMMKWQVNGALLSESISARVADNGTLSLRRHSFAVWLNMAVRGELAVLRE
jgi:hypothetical protein